ncbi:ankyrin [Hyaloscypha variabilis F]|uniref:Ankyrin n=1 Tax=Hyaloscypha variabilis (strain UAMH 11265 / GT02V1 / F) TaxID=1149755 RepID=A0A2J6QWC6_HYAVF|nr:ankyrin [Hyaloscypha variabilis F]
MVRFLIAHGADVNGFHEQALARACGVSSTNIAKILLSSGANINVQGGLTKSQTYYVLDEACLQGNSALVQLLLKHGANPNLESARHIEYGTPLQVASYFGHTDIVEILLANGANVNALTCRKYSTALQCACAMGRTATCLVLLKHGADINLDLSIITWYGWALDTACHKGNEEVVRLLIAAGASINASGGMYGCPLQAACACGDEYGDLQIHTPKLALAKANIVRMLLDHGARVDTLGGIYGNSFCAALEARFLNARVIFSLLLGRSTGAVRLWLFHNLLARQKDVLVKDARRRKHTKLMPEGGDQKVQKVLRLRTA